MYLTKGTLVSQVPRYNGTDIEFLFQIEGSNVSCHPFTERRNLPVEVQVVESAPLGFPGLDVSLEWCSRVRRIAVRSDETKVLVLTRFLNAGENRSLLLPTATIAASNLGRQTSLLEAWSKNLNEVGSLATARLHRSVRGAEIRLIQEAYVIDVDALCRIVLDILDELVGVGLPPVATLAFGAEDTAEIATVGVGVVGLHVAIRGPRIGVDVVHAASLGLFGEPDLVLITSR